MRLHRHEELVKAMETAILSAHLRTGSLHEKATAALDALLDAAVRLEVAIPAVSTKHKLKMKAPDETEYTDVEYMTASSEDLEAVGDDALILRMDDSDDK